MCILKNVIDSFHQTFSIQCHNLHKNSWMETMPLVVSCTAGPWLQAWPHTERHVSVYCSAFSPSAMASQNFCVILRCCVRSHPSVQLIHPAPAVSCSSHKELWSHLFWHVYEWINLALFSVCTWASESQPCRKDGFVKTRDLYFKTTFVLSCFAARRNGPYALYTE